MSSLLFQQGLAGEASKAASQVRNKINLKGHLKEIKNELKDMKVFK